MNKRKKQLTITILLLIAGLALGFAFGLLIIPTQEFQNTETTVTYNTIGNEQNSIRIVEYSDYECYYCALFYKNIYKNIILPEIENGNIYYQYRDYPLLTFDNNLAASFAAHCAGKQNQFWPMHDKIFDNQNLWIDKEEPGILFKKFAQDIGLNMDTYESCIISKNPAPMIQAGIENGKTENIKTTPTVFINDQKIEGLKSADYYRNIIQNEIEKAEQ